MLKVETIICPVDFSEFSLKAYDYAYSLAKHYKAQLLVEHVVQPLANAYPYYPFPEAMLQETWVHLTSEAEKSLHRLVNGRSRNGLEPNCLVRQGLPTDSILSLAEERSADLIVMGTHGRRGLSRLSMGSVTESVLRRARCPVLAVRKPAHDFVTPEDASDSVHMRKLLLATDFSDHAGRALGYAFSLAMEYNAQLTLLHIVERVGTDRFMQEGSATAIANMEKSIPEDVRNWCTVSSLVRIGTPYEEIIQLAQEDQSDLIIVGVRGRNVVDLALFGSTTQRVLQLRPCPVLAVHV